MYEVLDKGKLALDESAEALRKAFTESVPGIDTMSRGPSPKTR